jgi:alkylhydroperoxidase family enzyme
MARLPVLRDGALDPKTLDAVHQYEQKNGMDSPLYRVLANNPAMSLLFNGYITDIKSAFSLGAPTEKLIILLIASFRKCEYCYTLHRKAALDGLLTAEQIDNILSYSSRKDIFSDKQIALLTFVEEAIRHSSYLKDETFSALKSFYSESEIVEIVLYIGLILTTTTINNTLKVDLPAGLKK